MALAGTASDVAKLVSMDIIRPARPMIWRMLATLKVDRKAQIGIHRKYY